IPVLLPNAGPPPGFLALNSWIDLRRGLDEDKLHALARAAFGERPERDFEEQLRASRASVCPYRGLEPFQEEDEPFFFGRDSFKAALIKTLNHANIVGIVGSSGSGKSSLVRAGLIPALRR